MKDGTIEAMSDALQLRAHKSNTALDRCTSTSAPSLRHHTLLQPGAADKRDYEGARAAASSGLSWVRRVGGVVGMLGV